MIRAGFRVPTAAMLALISPAKTLDAMPRPEVAATTPEFLDRAATLVRRLEKFSPADLSRLMGVSDKLAAENVARFRAWRRPFTRENATPAVFLFRGDVYAGLQADDFDIDDLGFAQRHLRILSGLYGLLRPLDLARPYRLEMGTTFDFGAPKTLYEFWGDAITAAVRAAIAESGSPVLLNLASQEYFKAVRADALGVRVVMPGFKEMRGGEAKMVSFHAKRARGLMARFVIVNRIDDAESLRGFDLEGYRYDKERSSADAPTFTRRHA